MPPTCSICKSPHRKKIEQALVAKVALRKIGFGTTPSSLQRHQAHVSQALAAAVQAKEIELGNALLDDIKELLDKAQELLTKAEETGDVRTALVGVREIGRLLELRGKATGELTPEAAPRAHQPMFVLPEGAKISVQVNQIQLNQRREPIETNVIVPTESGEVE